MLEFVQLTHNSVYNLQCFFVVLELISKKVDFGMKGHVVTGKVVTHGVLGPEEDAAHAGLRQSG